MTARRVALVEISGDSNSAGQGAAMGAPYSAMVFVAVLMDRARGSRPRTLPGPS
jgi:hypothetical protein